MNYDSQSDTTTKEQSEAENSNEVDLRDHQLIGAGGENLVFVDGNKTEVVKINYFTISDLKTNREKALLDVTRRNQDVEQLRKYFGSQGDLDHTLHPPGDAYRIAKVHLSQEQLVQGFARIGAEASSQNLQRLGVTDDANSEVTIEAIVAHQAYLPLDELKTQPFSFESYDQDKEPEILNSFLVDFTCQTIDRAQCENKLRDMFPSIAPLLDQPSLQSALRDFVQSLIRFIKGTGRSIDFEGRENIFFIEGNDQSDATYVLMDVLQAEPKDYLDSKRTFEKKRNGEISEESNIDEVVVPELYQFYGINLLASTLGIEDRIDSFTSQQGDRTVSQQEFQNYIREVVEMRSKKV